jgi:hypothetical protein
VETEKEKINIYSQKSLGKLLGIFATVTEKTS